MGLLEAILIQSGAYALISYIVNRKKSFEEGYGLFIILSSIAASIFSWGSLVDYIMALDWYDNLFWLFQILILLLSFLSIPLLFSVSFIVFFYLPQQLFLVLKGKPKLFKFLSEFFGTLLFILGFGAFVILVLAGFWWFFPDKEDICHRYLDGRYSKKTAVRKWKGTGGRYGSQFGLIDNCRKYIPYVDPDKLIINKEGFWDSFYSD